MTELPYRLCAVDLDDTLLGPDHQISARNARAIAAVRKMGVTVCIASGRMYASTLPYAKSLDLDTPIISYNGAMVRNPVTDEVLLDESIPADLAGEILEYCESRKLQLNFYLNDLLYSAQTSEWLDLYHSRTLSPIEIRPDMYELMRGKRPTKLIIVDDPKRIIELNREMSERYKDQLYITISNAEYLEFMPVQASKAAALAHVANRFGVPQAQTIAFGDSNNDIPMLLWAGLGLAVSNGKPAVIEAANRTIGASAEDGVGMALEQIFDLKFPINS